jgi:voltage-gated potassium channel
MAPVDQRSIPHHLKHHAQRAYPGARHILRILLGTGLIVLVMAPTGELARYNVQGALIGALALLIVLLGLFIVFVGWRLRRLEQARYPGWAALELYALAVVMFLAIFSKLYLMISLTNPASFTEQLDHFTAYYFALTVLATVGFGDITPVTVLARSLTMVQMALDLTFLALLVRLVSTHRQRAHEAKTANSTS